LIGRRCRNDCRAHMPCARFNKRLTTVSVQNICATHVSSRTRRGGLSMWGAGSETRTPRTTADRAERSRDLRRAIASDLECKRKWENKTVVMGSVERGAWGSRNWQEGMSQRSDRSSSEATLALADKLKQHLRPGRQPRRHEVAGGATPGSTRSPRYLRNRSAKRSAAAFFLATKG
jgi:hypothetical protein